MANIAAAKKWTKQSARRRDVNIVRVHALKSATKAVKQEIAKKDAKAAEAGLPAAYKAIDKAVKGGMLKKNTAARRKARLTKAVAKIEK